MSQTFPEHPRTAFLTFREVYFLLPPGALDYFMTHGLTEMEPFALFFNADEPSKTYEPNFKLEKLSVEALTTTLVPPTVSSMLSSIAAEGLGVVADRVLPEWRGRKLIELYFTEESVQRVIDQLS